MFAVGFATQDWALSFEDEDGFPTLGGSGHYRVGLPARALREAGHEVILGRLVAHNHVARLGVKTWSGRVEYPPVIVLQRWMNADLAPRIRAAVEAGQVVLNDVDDWWEGLDPANRAWATSAAAFDPDSNRDHYRAVLAASSALVCSTPFLADRYRKALGARTYLVRNAIDLDRWTPQEPREGLPVLGWVGALPWRSRGDVEALRGFLGPFCTKHGLKIIHGGHLEGARAFDGSAIPTFAEVVKLKPWWVETRPMAPITLYPDLWQGIDVALCPLADKPFNHAKSAVKPMEAAASGLPVVMSDTPEYRWLHGEHGIGTVARRSHDWVRRLTKLLDPAERAAEAAANREAIRALGLAKLREDWEALLASVYPVAAAARG